MMFKSRIWVIYVKELVDILRDRRTLIAMIVVPVLLYPLLMLGSVQAISVQESSLRESTIVRIAVPDASQERLLQQLIHMDTIALRNLASVTSNGVDDGLPRPLRAEVVVADTDLETTVRTRQAHVGLDFVNHSTMSQPFGQLRVIPYYDSEEVRSDLAGQWVIEMLTRCGQRERQRRLAEWRIPTTAVEPIKIESHPVASAGSVLSQILPLILVLMTITGAIYPAIDLTAGERERGTLETLMVCPVPVIHLIVGKFMVITTIAIMGAVLNLASISATVYFGGFQAVLASSSDVSFPFAVFPVILLALIPFAIFFSAVMIAVCSYAHTFKEAQNYVTPIILAALVPGGIAALPASKLAGPMLVMPVANMVLLTKELLLGASEGRVVGGNVTWTALAWVVASTVLYAGAAVAVAAKIFGTESVIFADTGSIRSAFSRRLFRPVPRPSVSMAALIVALLFPIWFYLQAGLGTAAGEDMIRQFRDTAILMPVFFVVGPLVTLWYWRIDIAETLRSGMGGFRFYLAAVLLGLAAWVPLQELVLAQASVLPLPKELLHSDQLFREALASIRPEFAVLLIAVIPGICEELFFRGFFMSGLRSSAGKWVSIVVSAVVFAVFHFLLFKIPTTFVLGIVLGYLCWQARSIWPAVLMHVVHNGGAVLRARFPGLEENLGVDASNHLPTGLIAAGVVVCVIGLLLCHIPVRNARAPQVP